VPLFGGGAGSPSNTMSPGPRPTVIPSGILINPTVWPQHTWAKNWGLCLFGERGAGFPVPMIVVVLLLCMVSADIEWPDEDEALSDSARSTIEALLSTDPRARPDALGQTDYLHLVLCKLLLCLVSLVLSYCCFHVIGTCSE